MSRVAFLSASCMLKDHPDVRKDYWEHDLEIGQLAPACAKAGIELDVRIWDDPDFDPADYDAVMIGTVWDYMEKPDQFRQVLDRCHDRSKLLNPLETVLWNKRKTYLKDLAERGAPMIPTLWKEAADDKTILGAFDALGAEDIVVKPVMGAGAWRQVRVRRGEDLPPVDQRPPAECMIQPFLPSVAEEGEYAFLFFGRAFSHCARSSVRRTGIIAFSRNMAGRRAIHAPS